MQFIEKDILEAQPDIVITHHPADTNNDHLQTSMACQEAIRLFQRRPEVKHTLEFWCAIRDGSILLGFWSSAQFLGIGRKCAFGEADFVELNIFGQAKRLLWR